jgi:hypothetical protein
LPFTNVIKYFGNLLHVLGLMMDRVYCNDASGLLPGMLYIVNLFKHVNLLMNEVLCVYRNVLCKG